MYLCVRVSHLIFDSGIVQTLSYFLFFILLHKNKHIIWLNDYSLEENKYIIWLNDYSLKENKYIIWLNDYSLEENKYTTGQFDWTDVIYWVLS